MPWSVHRPWRLSRSPNKNALRVAQEPRNSLTSPRLSDPGPPTGEEFYRARPITTHGSRRVRFVHGGGRAVDARLCGAEPDGYPDERPDDHRPGPPPGADAAPAAGSEDNGPSIFTALHEQLGLKLESQRGPVEVLVIDSVEQPTED